MPPPCPIAPPAGPPPRYSPRPFPAYRYVPGLYPHPTADPDGHSYLPGPRGAAGTPADPLPDPDGWARCGDYLYGVDLYNHAYWWEAHEAWEGLWRQAAARSLPSRFFQGLIQIAAAHLKRHLRRPLGVHRLAARGLANLWLVQRLHQPRPVYMGLHLPEFIEAVECYFQSGSAAPGMPRGDVSEENLDTPVTCESRIQPPITAAPPYPMIVLK